MSSVSAFGIALAAVTAMSGATEASFSGGCVSLVALALVQRDLNTLINEEPEGEMKAQAESAEPEMPISEE